MRLFKEIKKDMEYPSPEVKIRCMNEVARYLRDACDCGMYSEVLDKLTSSKYRFGMDANELMALLSERYKCNEICDKVKSIKRTFEEKRGVPIEGDFRVSVDEKYQFAIGHIYGKKVDFEHLTCENIDDFVKDIEVKKIPGALYPFMWYTHFDNEKVFLYIYTQYVLPAFIDLSESGDMDKYEILSSIMSGYIDELLTYVQGMGEVFITSLPRYTSWDDVIVHFQKTGEFECIEIVKEKLKGVHGIGTKLLEFHKKSKNRIKKKYQTYVFDYYPMFTGLVLFALISEGKDEEAVQFMMDHYPDVSEGNTQCAYVLILLLKTILLADNYEYMNILYADLQKEKLLYQRSYKDIYDVLMQSCKLIEELYHKICLPKEDRFFEEHTRFIKETVFEEWGLIQDVRNIKNEYNHAQDQVKADMFLRIYNCINALSNTEGIHVALIGQTYGKNYRNCTFIKEKHHDDKVAMVIPWDGVDKAGRILTQLGDVDKGATSISNRSFFDRVDIVIKDILLEKLEDDIESMLHSIKEFRQKPDCPNQEDQFLEMMEPHILSLTKRISAKYIDREQIISYLKGLDNKGCWGKLDDECISMLVTSEIVYRSLISREDAEELDYSASMIPLTKVIEYLLNNVYNKIKYNIIFEGSGMNIDSYSVKHFKDNKTNGPKECIEMGPAIRMLSDGFLKNDDGRLFYGSYFLWPKKFRFAEWGGNDFIDWSRLNEFKGITLNGSGFDTDSPIHCFTIGTDEEYNRKIFIGALEYIKNCYRNKVAHKDGIERERMDKCREDMLIAQKLIWMLVHIMK